MRSFFMEYRLKIQQSPAVKFTNPFTLGWTHYVLHAREYQWARAAGERSQ